MIENKFNMFLLLNIQFDFIFIEWRENKNNKIKMSQTGYIKLLWEQSMSQSIKDFEDVTKS